MEKIMSKTNDTSNVGYGAPKDPAALKEHRTLDDAELEVVTGGRTDVIKAMGNTSWGDIALFPRASR